MTPSLFDGTSGWPVSTVSVGMTSTILAATEPYEDDHDSLITFGMSLSSFLSSFFFSSFFNLLLFLFSLLFVVVVVVLCFVFCKIDT